MASAGVKVFYFHRTLEEYMNEFLAHGFRLCRISDLDPSGVLGASSGGKQKELYTRYYHFPFLMVLEFIRGS
jgi:hypothetical protein